MKSGHGKMGKLIDELESGENERMGRALAGLANVGTPHAILHLLPMLDMDEDSLCTQASGTIARIIRRYGDIALEPIQEFIEDHLYEGGERSRAFAYEIFAPMTESDRAKQFLLRMFEEDEDCLAQIASLLVAFGDRRILSMLVRHMEIAKRWKNDFEYQELLEVYLDFIGAKKGTEITIPSFNIDEYLSIRVRGDMEDNFESALRLTGLNRRWNTEMIQKLIDQVTKPLDVLRKMQENFSFPTDDSMEEFTFLLIDLWNNTPRTEFNGLTPFEIRFVGQHEIRE